MKHKMRFITIELPILLFALALLAPIALCATVYGWLYGWGEFKKEESNQ